MSVGLPSWSQLIKHMRAELDLPPDSGVSNSYQTLAEYYRLKHGSIGPLRSWMDRRWSVSEERVKESRIHELIVALDFPTIYTTNYDSNLEVAYGVYNKAFVKVVNAKDLAQADDNTTKIIKFHGDFEDDQSLVIAETDYFRRLSFSSPLDIRFKADALGRTLLFIGYSVSDLNIRLLLYTLSEVWRASKRERDRPESFVFSHVPDAVEDAVLRQWGISMISNASDTPNSALQSFLELLKEKVDSTIL
jgi:hypothetical protein